MCKYIFVFGLQTKKDLLSPAKMLKNLNKFVKCSKIIVFRRSFSLILAGSLEGGQCW